MKWILSLLFCFILSFGGTPWQIRDKAGAGEILQVQIYEVTRGLITYDNIVIVYETSKKIRMLGPFDGDIIEIDKYCITKLKIKHQKIRGK